MQEYISVKKRLSKSNITFALCLLVYVLLGSTGSFMHTSMGKSGFWRFTLYWSF